MEAGRRGEESGVPIAASNFMMTTGGNRKEPQGDAGKNFSILLPASM
jgi:hypothetical protein